jgi:hypothetical protein
MTRISRDLIRHLEWVPGKTAVKPASQPPLSAHSSLSIDDLADRYVISSVAYRDGLYEVSLSKELLDSGTMRTQDDWVAHLASSEWRLPSGPLAIALYTTLYTARKGPHTKTIAAIQRKLRKDHKEYWMSTGTRIKYSPNGLDTIIHEYGTPDANDLSAEVVGPDDWVTPESGFEGVITALLGTCNIPLLEDVSAWASGKKPYLWRVNNAPSFEDERALVLGVSNGGRFNIDANYNVNINRPARGVAVRKIFTP